MYILNYCKMPEIEKRKIMQENEVSAKIQTEWFFFFNFVICLEINLEYELIYRIKGNKSYQIKFI